MTELRIDVPDDLAGRLADHARATGTSTSAVVRDALEALLDGSDHTAFQVSTTGALVEGVYAGAAAVGHLRAHGDFGLGTFEGLDGEMVILDGECFRVGADGTVASVSDAARTPFAIVTRFHADRTRDLGADATLGDLAAHLDALRDSDNLFFAVRVDGRFRSLTVRAACRVDEGTRLAVATQRQSEWRVDDVSGTIVGFWSPVFSSRFEVPGYHLHFLDARRERGGHVLGAATGAVRVGIQRLDRLAVELPETASFLAADLSADPAADLTRAEQARTGPSGARVSRPPLGGPTGSEAGA